ncbi:MAG: ATP-binding protein, partial [Thermodesulfobacteriota bacterium]
MSKTISDRLAQASKTSFVGRKAEFELLLNSLESEELPFQVAFIHGMGGIGKTHLVNALINTLNKKIQLNFLDCRNIEPTPKGFLTAFCNESGFNAEEGNELSSAIKNINDKNLRTLIVLDTYETFGLMDTWLRQMFIPSLSQNVLTIIISRQPPNSAWITTPGWDSLLKVIRLDALTEDESYEMLQSRGLNHSQTESINNFARGYPLAIELAAAALKSQPELNIDSAPPAQVLQNLTNSFLLGLPVELKEAVEASSTTRRLSETVLRELLGSDYHRDLFDKLLDLPFVNPTTDGLIVHDIVRDTVRNDLEKRDPERLRSYRTRAWRHFTNESLKVESPNLWQCTADLLYLIQNPVLRDAFFPRAGTEDIVEPASLNNKKDILEIAKANENEEAFQIIDQLLERHLEFFNVTLNRNGDVDGFFILFQPHEIDSDIVSKDPITLEYFRHLRDSPVSENECVLILRRWLSKGSGELPSNSQAACWIDVKR